MKNKKLVLSVLFSVVVASGGLVLASKRYVDVVAPGTGLNDVYCPAGSSGGFCGERDGSSSDIYPSASGHFDPWASQYRKQMNNYPDNRGYDRGYDSGYTGGSSTSCSGQCFTTYDPYKY